MESIHIALIGFGTVGKGIYESIHEQREQLESLLQRKVIVEGVLIKDGNVKREIDDEVLLTTNIDDLLGLPNLDVVFEAINGVEPARTYLSKCIQRGCHIVTANKELMAHKGNELRNLAANQKVGLRFEAAVAASIPILSTLREGLKSNQIQQISGILNGTSNFILTEVQQKNISFEHGLKLAQEYGYAEADPTNDIEGWDAFYKILILSDLVYGKQPDWDDVVRKGISEVTSSDINKAEALGLRIKHTATIVPDIKGPIISVEPVALTPSHPFFHVTGVNNCLQLTGNLAGEITLQGPGAGAFPTASAMIEDFLSLYRNSSETRFYSKAEGEDERNNEWLLLGDITEADHQNILPMVEQGAYYMSGKRSEVEDFLRKFSQVNFYPIHGQFAKSLLSQLVAI
ncbi:homoserine dehydrogenase [Pseudalkalibacillus hwajinpoensis]|uniref:homoserine dehydrogenase n=1 Tax=Guptibacillus hwajinpoensis TaxID=208199 RepID=UPI00325B88A3